jgi:ABC-type bacteriocin/lantibiotic exporter with double-glycine peptidase domain
LSILFKPSEITSVSGKNGSGKTTLVKLITGFLKPKSGEILIDQTNLDKLSLVWFREQVAYVSQRIEVLGSSIIDNILISNTRLNELEISRLLQTVGLDNELKKSNLSLSGELNENISNGILKKIQIARSIARNSKIYLFDDPLLYLDAEGKEMVIKLLSSLKRSGKTVVCFSNDEDIINLCDNKIILGKDDDK